MFLISVFAIFNFNNLNLCHINFDVNKNYFNCKTFTTEILDINRIRHSYGEMAEITYSHFDQHYSKYIFRNSRVIIYSMPRKMETTLSFIGGLILCHLFYFYANNFTTQN